MFSIIQFSDEQHEQTSQEQDLQRCPHCNELGHVRISSQHCRFNPQRVAIREANENDVPVRMCRCGSTDHQRVSHHSYPLNSANIEGASQEEVRLIHVTNLVKCLTMQQTDPCCKNLSRGDTATPFFRNHDSTVPPLSCLDVD